MKHDYPDSLIKRVLSETNTIAMIGASPTPTRSSHGVMKYLQDSGYRVIPVNPFSSDTKILGEFVYASLADIPEKFEMVDVFRRSDAIASITEEALSVSKEKGIRSIWMQLGVIDETSANKANSAGLTVIMDRCLKIEYAKF